MNFKAIAASLALSLSMASNSFGENVSAAELKSPKALTPEISDTKADNTKKIIPPKQWWQTPYFSPDGSKVAIQTPPPEIVEMKLSDNRTVRGQKDVPRSTVILKTSDFSQIADTQIVLWPEWSPDGKLLCGNMLDKTNLQIQMGIYDPLTGKRLRAINEVPPSRFAWSPDSTRLFLTQRNNLSILDLSTKSEMLLPVKDGESYFDWPTWSPDGKLIAATLQITTDGTTKRVVRIWDVQSRNVCNQMDLKQAPGEVRWSPGGKTFVLSQAEALNIFDVEGKQKLKSIETVDDKPVRFNWSPDKSKLAYKDAGAIHLLDAETLEETTVINGPANGFFDFSWTTDSKYLLISAQNTAAICDASTGAYCGYKTWPDATRHVTTPDQKLLIVINLNSLTESEPLVLPPAKNISPFKNGKVGSPGWENNASPKTIEESFAQFDKELSPANRARFKGSTEEQIGNYGGGSFITDSMMADVYDRWNSIPLNKYFATQGISDPRNVTEILLKSYWRYLNKKPIGLDEQIAEQRAWWDNQRPVIESSTKLPTAILDFKITDKAGTVSTIASLAGKLKIIAFVDSDGLVSAQMVKYLKELRLTYPDKQLSIIVLVVPPESLTKEKWPAIRTIVMGQGDEPLKAIANFKSNPGDIFVDAAPDDLTQALLRMIRPSKYSRLGLPQTLLVTDDMIKIRLNGFEERTATAVVEREIKRALESK